MKDQEIILKNFGIEKSVNINIFAIDLVIGKEIKQIEETLKINY